MSPFAVAAEDPEPVALPLCRRGRVTAPPNHEHVSAVNHDPPAKTAEGPPPRDFGEARIITPTVGLLVRIWHKITPSSSVLPPCSKAANPPRCRFWTVATSSLESGERGPSDRQSRDP